MKKTLLLQLNIWEVRFGVFSENEELGIPTVKLKTTEDVIESGAARADF
jgi:hypothetical protein